MCNHDSRYVRDIEYTFPYLKQRKYDTDVKSYFQYLTGSIEKNHDISYVNLVDLIFENFGNSFSDINSIYKKANDFTDYINKTNYWQREMNFTGAKNSKKLINEFKKYYQENKESFSASEKEFSKCCDNFIQSWLKYVRPQSYYFRIETDLQGFRNLGHGSYDKNCCFRQNSDINPHHPILIYHNYLSFVIYFSRKKELLSEHDYLSYSEGRAWGLFSSKKQDSKLWISNLYTGLQFIGMSDVASMIKQAIGKDNYYTHSVSHYDNYFGVYTNSDTICLYDSNTTYSHTNFNIKCLECGDSSNYLICKNCLDGESEDHDNEFCCSQCGDVYDLDRSNTVNDSLYCDDCYHEHFVGCEDCDSIIERDSSYYIDTCDIAVCESCYSNYFYCEHCEHDYYIDDLQKYDDNDNELDFIVCKTCFEKMDLCHDCNKFQLDTHKHDNGKIQCKKCFDNEVLPLFDFIAYRNGLISKIEYKEKLGFKKIFIFKDCDNDCTCNNHQVENQITV